MRSSTGLRREERAGRAQVRLRSASANRQEPHAADLSLAAAGLFLRLGARATCSAVWASPAPGLGDGPLSGCSFKAGYAILANLPMLFGMGVAIGIRRGPDGSRTGWPGRLPGLQERPDSSPPSTPIRTRRSSRLRIPGRLQVVRALVVTPRRCLGEGTTGPNCLRRLAFFSGRRLVPMTAALAGIIWAWLRLVWPPIGDASTAWPTWMYVNGGGAGMLRLVNRLLVPTGLHHIINSFVWFQASCVPASSMRPGSTTAT